MNEQQVDFSIMLPNGIIQEVLEEYLKNEFKRAVRVVAAKPIQDGYMCALAYVDTPRETAQQFIPPIMHGTIHRRQPVQQKSLEQQYSQEEVNSMLRQVMEQQFEQDQRRLDQRSESYMNSVGPIEYETPEMNLQLNSLEGLLAQFESEGLVKKHGE